MGDGGGSVTRSVANDRNSDVPLGNYGSQAMGFEFVLAKASREKAPRVLLA
jgi:hypothetical protein